jgi:hypothetical protein
MLMDAFSALLVALPLLLPLAATFGIQPFHLAVMFLLNMELAYITPPVGLNLYISSFRFNRPVVQIYRVVMPFVGLLGLGLLTVILVPKLSGFTVEPIIAAKRAEAEKSGMTPREAWLLECVQEDKNNPRPCTAADRLKYGEDGQTIPGLEEPTPTEPTEPAPGGDSAEDDLMKEMMGQGGEKKGDESAEDKLLEEMLGEPSGDKKPAPEKNDGKSAEDKLLEEMLQ